ncbi:MAG: hypothetical protein HZA24_06100 [Nitrospirae bacterium]|nr:hypothetical protein [Nitrospirota bacterium]
MSININTALRNALLDGVLNTHTGNIFDGGTAVLELWTTAYSASSAGGALTGTMLCSIALPAAAFGAAATGAAALSAAISAAAGATGTAATARLRDATSTHVLDGNVTATGGGGFLELSSTAITSGGTVTVNSLSLTMPAA